MKSMRGQKIYRISFRAFRKGEGEGPYSSCGPARSEQVAIRRAMKDCARCGLRYVRTETIEVWTCDW